MLPQVENYLQSVYCVFLCIFNFFFATFLFFFRGWWGGLAACARAVVCARVRVRGVCVCIKTVLCLHLLLNDAMHLNIVQVGE